MLVMETLKACWCCCWGMKCKINPWENWLFIVFKLFFSLLFFFFLSYLFFLIFFSFFFHWFLLLFLLIFYIIFFTFSSQPKKTIKRILQIMFSRLKVCCFSVKHAQIIFLFHYFSLCLVVTTFPRNHFMISTIFLCFLSVFFCVFLFVFFFFSGQGGGGYCKNSTKLPLLLSVLFLYFFYTFVYFCLEGFTTEKGNNLEQKKRNRKKIEKMFCDIKKSWMEIATAAFEWQNFTVKLCDY